MPFLHLSKLLRRHQRPRQRDPICVPVPTTTTTTTTTTASPSPRVAVVVSGTSAQRRSLIPPIWGTAAEMFTGVKDVSWYEDGLDVLVNECAGEVGGSGVSEVQEGEVEVEVELMFDADVWVQLARAENLGSDRLCVGVCAVGKVYGGGGDADGEELRHLTEAFVGEYYYDGECATCLHATTSLSEAICLPGEDFWSLGNVLLAGQTSAAIALDDFHPAEHVSQDFYSARDEESVNSETESIFDHMDDLVRDALWVDEGVADVSTVQCLAYGTFDGPLTPRSMVSDGTEYGEDAIVVDISEAEEALRSDLSFEVYYFDADTKQFHGYTAFNQLLAFSKPNGARSVNPKPSVRTGRAMGSHNMY